MLKTNKNLKKAAMALAVCATVFTVPTPVSAAKPSTATVKRAYEKYASKNCYPNQNIHMEHTLCMTLTGMVCRKCFLNI